MRSDSDQPDNLGSSSERLAFELYAGVRRSSAEHRLLTPVSRHWGGDLVVGSDAAMLFANLDSGARRWELRSQTQLRMHERRSSRSPVSSWRPYIPSVMIHAFALPSRGQAYLYLGTVRVGAHGGKVSESFGQSIHVDCRVRPPVPFDLWRELRAHQLEIDGQLIENGPDGEPVWSGTLGEVLDPLRHRRRAEATIRYRGIGEITYSKNGRHHILTLKDRHGGIREAKAGWDEGAHDALSLFWVEGLAAPWLEWL